MPNPIDLSQMSDDDAAKLSGAQPQQPQAPKTIDLSTLTDADAARLHTPAQQQSSPIKMTDIGRSLEQGATFGFGDELNAYLRSKGLWAGSGNGEDYEKALADERARMANFQEQHPVAAAGSEIIGGLPAMMLPGAAPYNGMRYLQNAKTAAQAVRRAIGVGTSYGAVSGFGHGEGDVGNRLENAAKTGAVSGALSGPFGYLGYKAGANIGGINAAREEAGANGDVPAAALNVLGQRFSRDKIDPVKDIVESQMLPATTGRTGLRALNTEQMQDAITQYRAGNITQDQLAQQFGISKGALANVLNRFDENTTTPMTLVDRAKMVRPGSGQNLEWRMRAAAATEGDARREAMENLTNNQLGQYSRLMDATNKYVGNGADDTIAAAQKTLKDSENAIYKAARATQKPYNIAPILDSWNNEVKQLSPSSPIGKGLKEAIDNFYDTKDVANSMGTNYMKQHTPIQGLERFQGAKENLDDLIEASMNNGSPSNLTRYLQSFKSDLMGEIANTNNVWKEANDTFTGAGREALKAGSNLKLQLGGKSREIEKQFARYEKQAADPNPAIAAAGKAQIDLFRQGFSRALQDGLQNKGQTNDLARTLVTPAAQKIMTRILGKDQAAAFNKILREEQTTTSTFNKIRGGSQTTPLREEIEDNRLPALISGFSDVLHPWELLTKLGLRAAGKIYSKRNEELMKHMARLDPVEQMNTLRSINSVKQAREITGAQGTSKVVPFTEGIAGSQSEQSSLKGGIGPRYDENANLREGQEDDMKHRRGFADGGIADTDDEDQGGIMPYLESNPTGWKDKPAMPPYQGEIKNIPADDYSGLPGPSLPASLAYDLSGIPTAIEGIRMGRQGSDEGRPEKMLQGMGETALSAAPYGMSRIPVAAQKIGAKAIGAGLATAGAAAVGSDLAEADKRRENYRSSASNAVQRQEQQPGSEGYAELRKQAGDDPKALALLSQLMQLEQTARGNIPGVNPASADKIRADAKNDLITVRNQLIDRITEMNAAHEPFDKAHSTLSQMLTPVATLAPFALGMGYGAWSKMPSGGWNRALKAAEREIGALESGSTVGMMGRQPSQFTAEMNLNKAKAYQDAYNNPPFWKKAVHEAVPAVAGAGIAAEARAYPHQYNRAQTPPDSQEHKDANEFLNNPWTSGTNAVWGALTGMTGKHIGAGFAPSGVRQNAGTNALRALEQGPQSGGVAAILRNVAGQPRGPVQQLESYPIPPHDGGGLGSGLRALEGPAPSGSPSPSRSSGAGSLGEPPPASAASPEAEAASKRLGGMGEAVKKNAGPEIPTPSNDADQIGDVPLWKQLGVHHSKTQPKDPKTGWFKGPPK